MCGIRTKLRVVAGGWGGQGSGYTLASLTMVFTVKERPWTQTIHLKFS